LYQLTTLRNQAFLANNARGAAFFTDSLNNSYLLVANSVSSSQQIYQWNPSSGIFNPPSSFSLTSGYANNFIVFELNSVIYMIDANTAGDCRLRYWNATLESFVLLTQTFIMGVTWNWGYVNTGTAQFLGQATDQGITNEIFQWSGTYWNTILEAGLNTGKDWNFFTIGTTLYACLSISAGSSVSPIYSYISNSWNYFGGIPTTSAYGSRAFQSNGNTFLAIADNKLQTNITYGTVYMWSNSNFTYVSDFVVQGARDIEIFTIGTQLYMFITNVNDGITNFLPCQLFHWNKYLTRFDLISSTDPTIKNNFDSKFFTINGKNYLYVADTGVSYVYKMGLV